jgi:hypothetical protein
MPMEFAVTAAMMAAMRGYGVLPITSQARQVRAEDEAAVAFSPAPALGVMGPDYSAATGIC